RHDLTLAGMRTDEIRRIVDVWADETTELGRTYPWVQVFENRGEAMGASNPHPHGQIWAGAALPVEASLEQAQQACRYEATGRPLLLDYAAAEAGGPRVVAESPGWLVVVPFWAAWPFETLVLPTVHAPRLADLDDAARDGLAAALRDLTRRYDALFDRPFPYSMGWHQAPFQATSTEPWQVHAHFYPPPPPPSGRNVMVGSAPLARPQRAP